jgi:hypothetical protein
LLPQIENGSHDDDTAAARFRRRCRARRNVARARLRRGGASLGNLGRRARYGDSGGHRCRGIRLGDRRRYRSRRAGHLGLCRLHHHQACGHTGYLVFLGVKALRSALRAGDIRFEPDTWPAAGPSLWTAFRDGLLCNALNPKAAIFFVALLPQFLPANPGFTDTLTLSAIAVIITAVWFSAVANLVAAFRRLFSRPAVRRTIDGLSGAVLIGLGVRLAFTSAR